MKTNYFKASCFVFSFLIIFLLFPGSKTLHAQILELGPVNYSGQYNEANGEIGEANVGITGNNVILSIGGLSAHMEMSPIGFLYYKGVKHVGYIEYDVHYVRLTLFWPKYLRVTGQPRL